MRPLSTARPCDAAPSLLGEADLLLLHRPSLEQGHGPKRPPELAGMVEAATAATRLNRRENRSHPEPDIMPIVTSSPPNPPVEIVETRLVATVYNPFVWLRERLGMAAPPPAPLAQAPGPV